MDPADIVLRNTLLKYLGQNPETQHEMPHHEYNFAYQGPEQGGESGSPTTFPDPYSPYERDANIAAGMNEPAYLSKQRRPMINDSTPTARTTSSDNSMLNAC